MTSSYMQTQPLRYETLYMCAIYHRVQIAIYCMLGEASRKNTVKFRTAAFDHLGSVLWDTRRAFLGVYMCR